MFRERKHRHAYVTKNEVLGQKVEQLEQLLRPLSRIRTQVIVRVVGLANSAEQDRHNTCKNKCFLIMFWDFSY